MSGPLATLNVLINSLLTVFSLIGLGWFPVWLSGCYCCSLMSHGSMQGIGVGFVPLSQLTGNVAPRSIGPPHQLGRFERLADWLFVGCEGPPFLLVRSLPFSVVAITEVTLKAIREFLAAGRPERWEGPCSEQIESLRSYHFFDGDPIPEQHLNRHVSAILLVSSHCNLTCPGCFASGGSYGMTPSHMKPEVIDATVAYVAKNLRALYQSDGYRGRADLGLHFFGGEPFIAFNRMQYAVDRASAAARELSEELHRPIPTDFFVTTNGTLMNRERVEFLREHNFTVMLSIDGPDHDSRRAYASGRGSVAEVINAYRALRSAGVKIRINTVVLARDMETAPAMLEWFKTSVYQNEPASGVWHTFSFEREGPALTVGAKSWEYKPAMVSQFIAALLEFSSRGYQIFEPDLAQKAQSGGTFYKCSSGVKRIAVGPEGEVYPCQGFIHESKLLGSVLDPEFDHRMSPLSLSMRQRNVATLQPCRDCVFSALCPHQVDCAARSYYTLGGINQIDVEGMCKVGYELMYSSIFGNNCAWLSDVIQNVQTEEGESAQ